MNIVFSNLPSFLCHLFFTQTSESVRKEETEQKLGLDKILGQVKAIDDIIISYLNLTVKLTYKIEEDLDNAKNYFLAAHWSKRDDLKLVALNLFEIISIYDKYMVKEIFPKNYPLQRVVKQLAQRQDVIANAVQYDETLLQYASEYVCNDAVKKKEKYK